MARLQSKGAQERGGESLLVIGLGERVMISEAQTAQQRHRNAFEAKMIYGRYIGHHGRTGPLLVLTEDGVKRGVGVKRLPIQERLNKGGWDKLTVLPWDIKVHSETLSTSSSSGRTTTYQRSLEGLLRLRGGCSYWHRISNTMVSLMVALGVNQ